MRKIIQLILAATTLIAGAAPFVSAHAHDLGVQGVTFPIGEIDMRLLEARSLTHVNVQKIHQQMVASAKAYPSHLPQYQLPPVRKTVTRYVDLTAVLDKNIMGMKQDAQGHWVWAVLWKKGTRVNPLDRVRPHTALLYFDAESRVQTRFALALFRKFPSRVSLVETQGDPVTLSTFLRRPVFYAQKKSLDRFEVTNTPSLVLPGVGAHRERLRVTVFGPPYENAIPVAAKILNGTWPDDGITSDVLKAAVKNYGPGAGR